VVSLETTMVSLETTMVSLETAASREEGITQSTTEVINAYINTCLVSKSIYYKKASQVI
jgi:hypothetical protein